jgi:beta-glucanase (GH16 family)
VTVRASTGTGIVTSFVLQSDDLDEVDWEWLGGDTAQVQTNYFGKGDTTTYDRGAYHQVANPQSDWHTYTVDWTKDYVKWYINGTLVRTLNYADAKSGTRFPQTPMQIKLGTWVAGGKDSAKGTVEWAGGYTDFSQAPFNAYYKSITIQDYSNGVSGAKAYSWGDGNSDGSYGSIKVLTDDSSVNTSSSSASATGTTMSTATVTSHGGLTQATDGTDTNSTVTSTGTQTIATPTVSGNSGSSATNTGATSTKSTAASTSAPASSGAFKAGASMVLVAGSAILAYLL